MVEGSYRRNNRLVLGTGHDADFPGARASRQLSFSLKDRRHVNMSRENVPLVAQNVPHVACSGFLNLGDWQVF